MNARRWRQAAWWCVLLLALAAAWALQSLRHKQALNAAIEARPRSGPILESAAHGRFALAATLAETGDDEAALNRYRALFDDPQLGAAARYNAANLLLHRALHWRESAQPGQSVAYFELAKEGYRALLRIDPDHWDARYNLERALRLQPDADPAEEPPPARLGAERAATTMRGTAQGLP
jgi:mxaK protein